MQKNILISLIMCAGTFSASAFAVVEQQEKQAPFKLGGYEFGLSVEKPMSIGEYNHYEVMYEDGAWYPKFQGTYYPLNFGFAALGGRYSIGYYSDSGKPVTGVTPPYDQDIDSSLLDDTQVVSLTMIPIDVGFDIRIAPFWSRFWYMNAWVSAGTSFIQETLKVDSDAGAANSESLDAYLNSGWITTMKYGASIAFNITQIDRSTIVSIRNYGVSGVYCRPYYEKTKTLSSSLGNFDQESYGIAFDFVSMK